MGHVPHVYVPAPWPENRLDLPAAARRHLATVLRLGAGDAVSYTDGIGRRGSGTFQGESIARGAEQVEERPAPELTVAVAAPRSTDRARFVVEKLAELGVDRLVWLTTRHGEGRAPRPAKSAAWAVGALEQSRGAYLLDVAGPVGWAALDRPLAVAAHGAAPPSMVTGALTAVVGPEAGFAPGEVPADAGRVGLGTRILRIETAAIAAATLLLAASGRLQPRNG